ncbi:hypothetical protein ABZV78_18640 [Micromonospora sp. NPDC004540]|uniref:hypothetical protein n=1 Tax=Micromonospora sp. NPDC004540 TaxID=3154457 RepID=UPI0033BAAD0A
MSEIVTDDMSFLVDPVTPRSGDGRVRVHLVRRQVEAGRSRGMPGRLSRLDLRAAGHPARPG